MQMLNFLRKMICPDMTAKISELEQDVVFYKDEVRDLNKQYSALDTKCQDLIEENGYYLDALGAHFYVFVDVKPITRQELRSIMSPVMGTNNIHYADNVYKTCSFSEMVEWLAIDGTAVRKFYKTEIYDCDDFAKRTAGNMATQENANIALFVVWSSIHAFNAFVDNDKKVWYIEPQTGIIIDPKDPNLASPYRNVMIVMG